MKKFVSLVLAMVMMMAMMVPAYADDTATEATKNDSITINNAVEGAEYKLYKLFDLVVDNEADPKSYSYTVNTAWAAFFAQGGAGAQYITVNDAGYVTAISDAAALAATAETYAANVTAVQTKECAEGQTSVVFDGLENGYWLITSSAGANAMTETTPSNSDVTINEKNETPTVEKEVQEDSTEDWGETNDADINQVVNFKATITVQAGAENYILHDTMSDGLTYTGVTSVKIGETVVDAANYTVSTNCEDGCTFEVALKNEFIDDQAADTKIVVYYSATLNENAVVAEAETNKTKLQYGDTNNPSFTPEDETTTYTWSMGVLKYGNGDETKVLAGASFVLLNSDKKKVANVQNGELVGWVDVTDEMNFTPYELTTGADGKISIKGLDADTYYLRETKAPDGYNKLIADIEVEVVAGTVTEGMMNYTPVEAKVNNQSGTELPSTGGMGTTMMYIAGGLLVAAAVVLLLAKRRANAAE